MNSDMRNRSDRKKTALRTFGWVALLGVLIAIAAVHALYLHLQTDLQRSGNDLMRKRFMKEIVSDVDTGGADACLVSASLIGQLGIRDDEEEMLFQMAEIGSYTRARFAVQALLESGSVQSLRLVKAFWRVCYLARGEDYFADPVLKRIYESVSLHVETALKAMITEFLKNDSAEPSGASNQKDRKLPEDLCGYFGKYLIDLANETLDRRMDVFLEGQEKANLYVDAYPVFEVLTYLAITQEQHTPPSGIYVNYDPTTLNLHRALYRWCIESTTFPDFYTGTEWHMFTAILWGDADFYRTIWKGLRRRDPLGAEKGPGAVLFSVNNNGIVAPKREVHVVVDPGGPLDLAKTLQRLLTRHSGVPATFTSSKEALSEVSSFDENDSGAVHRPHAIMRVLYVTLDPDAFAKMAKVTEKQGIEALDSEPVHYRLLGFLPRGKTPSHAVRKSSKAHVIMAQYDPEDPFAPEADALEIIVREFVSLAIGAKPGGKRRPLQHGAPKPHLL
jgi:hypothetical protein